MTNRVLLNINDGLKVSKPGFDVLTTGDENLLFSSKWGYFSVFQTGSFGPGPLGPTLKTIPWTQTFTSPPVVLFYSPNKTFRGSGGGATYFGGDQITWFSHVDGIKWNNNNSLSDPWWPMTYYALELAF